MRMVTAASEVLTEEEIINDELSENGRLYPKNAEIRKLDLKIG